jgi:hypothetical protein
MGCVDAAGTGYLSATAALSDEMEAERAIRVSSHKQTLSNKKPRTGYIDAGLSVARAFHAFRSFAVYQA